MKELAVILLLSSIFLVSCGGSQEAISKAVQQTLDAEATINNISLPTNTLLPTASSTEPIPSTTPIPTLPIRHRVYGEVATSLRIGELHILLKYLWVIQQEMIYPDLRV